MKELRLLNGDCLDKLKELEDNSIDSIVTDPPYGLSFMGKKWDYDVPSVEIWQECLRVLKPGGHLLAFAGSRTYHRMAVRIEDAGFDIRDQIMWIYGSGFPKSHQLGDGWGTALKPAHEPIVMARKPFKGSCKDNHKEYGVGGLNIDGTRIGNEVRTTPIHSTDKKEDNTLFGLHATIQHHREETTQGRWPANIILECTCENPKVVADKYDIRAYNDYKNTFKSYEENDKDLGEYEIKDVETTKIIHTDPNCPCYILDKQSGKSSSKNRTNFKKDNTIWQENTGETDTMSGGFNDEGGASRFFYCPKANKKDREQGNIHPTVKPTDLMKYLIRLVTPKDGIVLDPFMGSGSTGKAAMLEGMWFVGIEREKEYYEIAKQRIEHEMDKRKFW